MAFNQPIEADRPSDLGLFSAFLRAPVIGPLMWILGGDMAKNLEKEEKLREEMGDCSNERGNGYDHCILGASRDISSVPDRTSSDLSQTDEYDLIEEESLSNTIKYEGLSNCKKLRASWSDETGHDLVEYLDETTSHEPPSDAFPVKSAIRRSGTIFSNNQNYSPSTSPLYGGSGGSVKSSNGYASPQWGWYVSTTPPQAEMYSEQVDKEGRIGINILEGRRFFNRGVVSSITGWPSVPL